MRNIFLIMAGFFFFLFVGMTAVHMIADGKGINHNAFLLLAFSIFCISNYISYPDFKAKDERATEIKTRAAIWTLAIFTIVLCMALISISAFSWSITTFGLVIGMISLLLIIFSTNLVIFRFVL